MVGVADAGGEVAVARDHAQAGDVDVRLFQVAAEVLDDRLEQGLGLVVVDEARLERGADLHIALDGHLVLRRERIDATEGRLDHVAGVLDQREGARARGEQVQMAVVEPLAPDGLVGARIEIHGVHRSSSRRDPATIGARRGGFAPQSVRHGGGSSPDGEGAYSRARVA
jgi:hypothetical protein